MTKLLTMSNGYRGHMKEKKVSVGHLKGTPGEKMTR